MEKIKVGIIGCGCIANAAHIPSYMQIPEVEIKYFCDIIPEKAQAAVEKYGCGTAVTDYHDILADPEVFAVSVCTPNLMHSIISIDCMKAGKHVLCEKPAARIYSEALEMQNAQHETGMYLQIGVCNRFNAAVKEVRERILAGELGNLYHVFINFRAHRSIPGLGGAFTNKSIAGGGVLIDWGVHRLDLVMYCTGDPKPLTVSGRAFSEIGTAMENYLYRGMWSEDTKDLNGVFDVDDSVSAFIRTEGPIISLEGAWAQNIEDGDDYIDFLGDKAAIRLRYGGDFTLYGNDGKGFFKNIPVLHGCDMYLEEIKSFLECAQNGTKNQAHIDSAVLTSKIMQGIYDSSDAGREVVLD